MGKTLIESGLFCTKRKFKQNGLNIAPIWLIAFNSFIVNG
jgi:hypothetical protein